MRLLERLVLEGITPERALTRLAKSGICVYHAKKIKKNQILLSVEPKDSRKVFAIYPNLCYNISVYSAYKTRKAGENRALSLLRRLLRRPGAIVGAVLLFLVPALSDGLVLRVNVVGATEYRMEVLDALQSYGVKKFSAYPNGREKKIAARLLTLDGVSYCAVEKSGTAVTVELRTDGFSVAKPQTGDLKAARGGVIKTLSVLGGTAETTVGAKVNAGDTLVGAYRQLSETERVAVTAMARVTIECEYAAEIPASDEKSALAAAILEIGVEAEIFFRTLTPTENGFFVTLGYAYTQSMNF